MVDQKGGGISPSQPPAAQALPWASQADNLCPRSPASNTHTVRVRYAETDQAGMAHHAAFFPWFEEGRVALLRCLGKPYQECEAEGLHFPVREAFCRYRAPARFDDVLLVSTMIEAVGGASIRFRYHITREVDGVLIAEGYTLHACVDDTGKVQRLPQEVKALLRSG